MARNLIPHFIHDQLERQNYEGRFQAATMFVDISGFTRLTETLMQYEKDGAEVLTGALNRIFNPVVAEIYAHGGFISTFAGDAFTALFPSDVGRDAIASYHVSNTAFFIQDFIARHGLLETKYGAFEMGVKVGLSAGEVAWGILGRGERRTYFFRGPAIDACAQAEHHAAKGEIVVGDEIWPHTRPAPRLHPFLLSPAPPLPRPSPAMPSPPLCSTRRLT